MPEMYTHVLRGSAYWFSFDNWSRSWSENMGTNLIRTLNLAAGPWLNNREITTPVLFRLRAELLIRSSPSRCVAAASNDEGIDVQFQNVGSGIREMRPGCLSENSRHGIDKVPVRCRGLGFGGGRCQNE